MVGLFLAWYVRMFGHNICPHHPCHIPPHPINIYTSFSSPSSFPSFSYHPLHIACIQTIPKLSPMLHCIYNSPFHDLLFTSTIVAPYHVYNYWLEKLAKRATCIYKCISPIALFVFHSRIGPQARESIDMLDQRALLWPIWYSLPSWSANSLSLSLSLSVLIDLALTLALSDLQHRMLFTLPHWRPPSPTSGIKARGSSTRF